MSKPAVGKAPPDWEQVLSSAARLQRVVPEAVLVGGTAAGIHAGHRASRDADHILAQLESVAGWTTARLNRPVLILGSLDGIETGVRQLIRAEPLETTTVSVGNQEITTPTEAEILRIKGFLLLRRNSARDYVDFAALADRVGRPPPPPSNASTGCIPRTAENRRFSRCSPNSPVRDHTISTARFCPSTTTSNPDGTTGAQ